MTGKEGRGIIGNINKTDKLDAKGLPTQVHLGSLPVVWLPPGEIRDERELHRSRMAFSKPRTALKNRIHSTLAKYALNSSEHSDIFVGKGRAWLDRTIKKLPPETGRCLQQHLDLLDAVIHQIAVLEERLLDRIQLTPDMQLLTSLPGVAAILAIVIEREIGTIERFPSAGHLAAYSGLVPKVHSSGGKTRYGHMRKQANNYLKWAFRAAPTRAPKQPTLSLPIDIAHHGGRRRFPRSMKGFLEERDTPLPWEQPSVQLDCIARHLAESSFWVLKKGEPYRDPAISRQNSPRLA